MPKNTTREEESPLDNQFSPPSSDDDDDEFDPFADDGEGDDTDLMDLSDAPDDIIYPTLPPGDYYGEVKSGEYTKSKSGNPMVVFQYTFGTDDGRKVTVFDHCTLRPSEDNDRVRFKQRILAIDPEYDLKRVNVRTIGKELAGRRVFAKLAVESYNGKPQNKLKKLMPLDSDGGFLDD